MLTHHLLTEAEMEQSLSGIIYLTHVITDSIFYFLSIYYVWTELSALCALVHGTFPATRGYRYSKSPVSQMRKRRCKHYSLLKVGAQWDSLHANCSSWGSRHSHSLLPGAQMATVPMEGNLAISIRIINAYYNLTQQFHIWKFILNICNIMHVQGYSLQCV